VEQGAGAPLQQNNRTTAISETDILFHLQAI
jgi:hypothetical protein